jgi:hypothetical protein
MVAIGRPGGTPCVRVSETQTEVAQREASREAHMLQKRQAEAEATGPSAWVPGLQTPSWGGLSSYTEQTPRMPRQKRAREAVLLPK